MEQTISITKQEYKKLIKKAQLAEHFFALIQKEYPIEKNAHKIPHGLKKSLKEAREGKLIGPFENIMDLIRTLDKPIQ